MRGSRIFNQLIKEAECAPLNKRGRNENLIHLRDECLIARYYYYSRMQKMNYEEVLKNLTCEFYLTPERIGKIIQTNTEQLQLLKQNETSLHSLKSKWAHLRW